MSSSVIYKYNNVTYKYDHSNICVTVVVGMVVVGSDTLSILDNKWTWYCYSVTSQLLGKTNVLINAALNVPFWIVLLDVSYKLPYSSS